MDENWNSAEIAIQTRLKIREASEHGKQSGE